MANKTVTLFEALENINVKDELEEIICYLSNYTEDCEHLEDIHGYLADLIGECYFHNPEILNLQVKEHYYVKKTRTHFYVVHATEDCLYGFLITAFGYPFSYTEEPRSKWNRFKCKEDCPFPRTMADILEE